MDRGIAIGLAVLTAVVALDAVTAQEVVVEAMSALEAMAVLKAMAAPRPWQSWKAASSTDMALALQHCHGPRCSPGS